MGDDGNARATEHAEGRNRPTHERTGKKGKGNDKTQEEAGQRSNKQTLEGMKLSMASQPLHERPVSTVAATHRHGLAYPVSTGEIRAAVRRALTVEGALFLEEEAP